MMPGSPADAAIAKLSQNGPVTDEIRRAVEAQLGVPDGNILQQYVDYLGQIFSLDFGVSYTFYPEPVSGLVAAALPYTLILVGLWSPSRPSSWAPSSACSRPGSAGRGWTRCPAVSGSFINTFPYFWTALLLLFVLGYVLHLFPTFGAYSATTVPGFSLEFLKDAIYHAALPPPSRCSSRRWAAGSSGCATR